MPEKVGSDNIPVTVSRQSIYRRKRQELERQINAGKWTIGSNGKVATCPESRRNERSGERENHLADHSSFCESLVSISYVNIKLIRGFIKDIEDTSMIEEAIQRWPLAVGIKGNSQLRMVILRAGMLLIFSLPLRH